MSKLFLYLIRSYFEPIVNIELECNTSSKLMKKREAKCPTL